MTTADANQWTANFELIDGADFLGLVFHTRVTARELQQYFPLLQRNEIPRKLWSRVAAIKRNLESGGEINFAVQRQFEDNRQVLGCVLQLMNAETYKIIISSADVCLRYEGIGVHGAPKLKLLNSLTRQGRKRLFILRQKATFGQLSKDESEEYRMLDELDSLERWYIEFKDGDGSQPVVRRFPEWEEKPAAD